MKKILIAGKDSYVGTSFEKWVSQWPEKYSISTIDTFGDKWHEKNFGDFDTILHVAAIVHKKEKAEMEKLYLRVNYELPVKLAQKAKLDGVKQFVFMSTMGVYGINYGTITKESIPVPCTLYGKSKLKAERELQLMEDDNFKITIIRPPMIYGENCKGNYPRLSKLSQKVPVFPDYNNERSMIYIRNLCEFIRLMIDNEENGIFFPQNKTYVNTTLLVREIAETYGKKIHFTKIFNPIIKLLFYHIPVIDKLFGTFICDKRLSLHDHFNYCITDFSTSVKESEGLIIKQYDLFE
ncbi:NAD-dependent epimerase/dehydratase family protein [Eubacterium callanderi]|uniref:NAD-dependent epimerase/dehydratase family protein n=1 Tax=Eubacterium callanderi TaxID=53442 RepID=UPI001C106232|nr:NAD-dependent epimerase/dehydratase family protein [Eubacterium callanderi]MBU5305928.1 NAD-dependent epimerase/dehydratase family protein [Eubacterium callanderi]WPK68880.1 N-acetyl-alpha-D-glucosaminyl-diphospho-ditrans,octacis-undecaprenol 4-epimerase [Eubacterium callanderi]WPK73178.1 N-acetyl-alpha-D-glucosaminyl-diphospho-ditrans,octacis-undecaprenol 4-epimerase [Eubacterium callanderi]